MQIGTLNVYQRIEDAARVDDGENTLVTRSNSYGRDVHAHEREFFGFKITGEHSRMRNCLLERTKRFLDQYAYCMSLVYDEALMHKFGGACVRIRRPFRFIECVSAALGDRIGRGLILKSVSYEGRTRMFDDPASSDTPLPGFLKPAAYAIEHEVRAVWDRHEEPQFVKINAPDIRSLIEIVQP